MKIVLEPGERIRLPQPADEAVGAERARRAWCRVLTDRINGNLDRLAAVGILARIEVELGSGKPVVRITAVPAESR
ncbi:MAG: hypothetical protein AB7R55_14710 [Gemmatimonadales bacterium]